MIQPKENPLKNYTEEQLISFYDGLDELDKLQRKITEQGETCYMDGILTDEGIGLARAFWICVMKYYEQYGIPLPEMTLEIGKEFVADFSEFSDILKEQNDECYFDERVYAELTGDGLSIVNDLDAVSWMDGIGDFSAHEGYGPYLDPESLLCDIYGEDWEHITAEDAELSEEEEKELPVPLRIGHLLAACPDDMNNGDIGTISDICIMKSEKIGQALNSIRTVIDDKKEKELAKYPIIEKFIGALASLNCRQWFVRHEYLDEFVEDNTWWSMTISSTCGYSERSVTVFQRLCGLCGYAWFAQEIAERVNDGRIVLPEKKSKRSKKTSIS